MRSRYGAPVRGVLILMVAMIGGPVGFTAEPRIQGAGFDEGGGPLRPAGTVRTPPPIIVADDFDSRNLVTETWSFLNPLNDVSLSMRGWGEGEAFMELFLPEARDHRVERIEVPRVMQPIDDRDFEYEVKFLSPMTERYQVQGILVQGPPRTFIRSDVFFTGGSFRAFWGTYLNGALTDFGNFSVQGGAPVWIKLTRQGDQWTMRYRLSGEPWQLVDRFEESIAVNSIGVFASNIAPFESEQAPPFTCQVDYAWDTASPIWREDQTPASDAHPPLVHSVQSLAGQGAGLVSWHTDEPSTGYVLYGTTPSLELGRVEDKTRSRDHRIVIADLLEDTRYYFKVFAEDDEDRLGKSELRLFQTRAPDDDGSTFDFFYGTRQTFGHLGTPQTWINVLGNVADADGIFRLSYSLNDGPSQSLDLGADNYRLADPGDFNAEIAFGDVPKGRNWVLFEAVDNLGEITHDIVVVDREEGVSWEENVDIDWTSVSRPEDVSQVIDGLWVCDGQGLTSVQLDYDRLIALGESQTWNDYEVTCRAVIRGLDPGGYDPPSNSPALGLIVRWPGHVDWDGGTVQPRRGWWPLGGIGLVRFGDMGDKVHSLEILGNEGIKLADQPRAIEFGQTYEFRFRVETVAPDRARLQLRFWLSSDPEPDTWDLEAEQDGGAPVGSLGLLVHHVDCTIETTTVTPLD